jgi:hypothetical protein
VALRKARLCSRLQPTPNRASRSPQGITVLPLKAPSIRDLSVEFLLPHQADVALTGNFRKVLLSLAAGVRRSFAVCDLQ